MRPEPTYFIRIGAECKRNKLGDVHVNKIVFCPELLFNNRLVPVILYLVIGTRIVLQK